jgi:uncharacterized protein YlzI (FlbEa/FlbD family)
MINVHFKFNNSNYLIREDAIKSIKLLSKISIQLLSSEKPIYKQFKKELNRKIAQAKSEKAEEIISSNTKDNIKKKTAGAVPIVLKDVIKKDLPQLNYKRGF